jgi:polyhydroxybutyrate depolymerase
MWNLLVIGAAILIALHTAYTPEAVRGEALAPGEHHGAIEIENLKRTYLLHIPPSYDAQSLTPLILAFHGRLGTGKDMETLTRLSEVADRHGFIAVYPDGIGRSWNAGHRIGEAQARGIDDVGFIRTLIDALSRTLNIDSKRVYATGMSNGGIFVYRLACELADKIAAVAVVAGAIAPDTDRECTPSRPIAVLHIHGSADRFAPWTGGKTKGGGKIESIPATVRGWVNRNKCSTVSKVTLQRNQVTCVTYDQCQGRGEITLCRIEGGGHTWPGGWEGKHPFVFRRMLGPVNFDINASELIWQFFVRHPMHD